MSNSKRRHRRRWRWQSQAWKRRLWTLVPDLTPFPGVVPHRLVLAKNEIHWRGTNEGGGYVTHVVSRYGSRRALNAFLENFE